MPLAAEGGAAETDIKKYDGYRLLDAKVSVNSDNTLNATYTVNTKYSSILQAALGVASDESVIDELSKKNDADLQAIADDIYRAIITADPSITSDSTTTIGEFKGVDTGYWLIAGNYSTGSTTPKTLVILNTVGKDSNVEITTKDTTVPDVTKEVKEGETWQSYANAAIGETVDFRITGTIPSAGFDSYEKYYYQFVDTLSAGLTYTNGSVNVYADATKIDSSCYTVVSPTDEGSDGKLTITFEDLKSIKAPAAAEGTEGAAITVTKDTKIYVEYTATLNGKAVTTAAGNPNTVKLVYSNDPYTTTHGETTEKTVRVFTYKLVINKVKEDGTTKLDGADFKLYKKVKATQEGQPDTWEEITFTTDENENKIYKEGSKEANSTEFIFKGLDVGEYKIEESVVPDGYNKGTDIEFTITPEFITGADGNVTGIETVATNNTNVTILNGNPAELTTTIKNQPGHTMPSTGGMGRTLIYVLGTICVLGAGVLLVTKRRMGTK